MVKPKEKRSPVTTTIIFSTFAILGLLYYVGIFNPWRIYRQAKVVAKTRSLRDLDDLESNTSKVRSIAILSIPLSSDKQRKVLDVIRHLGPYDDEKIRVPLPPSDPRAMQAVDQLRVFGDFRFQGDLYRINVNELNALDRDEIHKTIGDPAQYGITDNTRPFSAR